MDDSINGWKFAGITVLVLVALFFLGIGGEYLVTLNKAATAPAHVANKFIDKAVDNSDYSYEKFRDMYNAFLAQKEKIAIAKQNVGNDQYAKTDLEGMQQACFNLVSEYNADSEKVTRNLFKMGGQLLPPTLNMEECR